MKMFGRLMIAVLLTLTVVTCYVNSFLHASQNLPLPPEQTSTGVYIGTVVETMNSAGYTYVQLDTGKEKIWVAAPETKVKMGEKLKIQQGAPMKNFYSKTLKRTFDMIYFVAGITQPGKKKDQVLFPKGHPNINTNKTIPAPLTKMDFSGIEKPLGGKTVAELYNEKKSISGKNILVRGKVVKFTSKIMGKNWIHLRDGTGVDDTNDLSVTTSAVAEIGDTILVRGVVAVNRDFGSGYKYDIIIEDADITIEHQQGSD